MESTSLLQRIIVRMHASQLLVVSSTINILRVIQETGIMEELNMLTLLKKPADLELWKHLSYLQINGQPMSKHFQVLQPTSQF